MIKFGLKAAFVACSIAVLSGQAQAGTNTLSPINLGTLSSESVSASQLQYCSSLSGQTTCQSNIPFSNPVGDTRYIETWTFKVAETVDLFAATGLSVSTGVTGLTLTLAGAPTPVSDTAPAYPWFASIGSSTPITLYAGTDYSLETSGSVKSGSLHDDLQISLTITAVPETATWAMMLLGFGGVAVMLRRQRSIRAHTA